MPIQANADLPGQADRRQAYAHLSNAAKDNALAEAALRVLIVDDDPADRTLLALLLKQSDSHILIGEQATGEAAKSILSNEQVDAVLLDYHLPDHDADTLISELRAIAGDDQLPIVVVSGGGDEDKAAAAMRVGASDYLTKERITSSALHRAITTAVAHAKLAQQLATDRLELVALNAEMAAKAKVMTSLCRAISRKVSCPVPTLKKFAIGSEEASATMADEVADIAIDLQELSESLSDIADMDSQCLNLDNGPFQIVDAIIDAVARTNQRRRDSRVSYTRQSPDDFALALGDAKRIR